MKLQKKYIDDVVSKYIVKPASAKAFGGRMVILGKEIYDNRKEKDVIACAEEIGKKMSTC